MKYSFLAFVLGATLPIANVPAQSLPDSALASDAEIRKILIERIDTDKQSVGIVVGVIDQRAAASSLMVRWTRTIDTRSTATPSSKSAPSQKYSLRSRSPTWCGAVKWR